MRFLGRGSVSHFIYVAATVGWWSSLLLVLRWGASLAGLIDMPAGPGQVIVGGGLFWIRLDSQDPAFTLNYFRMHLVLWLATLAPMLLLLHQLRRTFWLFTLERPFEPELPLRIRLSGLALLLMAIIRPIGEGVIASYLYHNLHVPGARMSVEIDFYVYLQPVLAALMVIVLAEVFGIGRDMKDEQDLTV